MSVTRHETVSPSSQDRASETEADQSGQDSSKYLSSVALQKRGISVPSGDELLPFLDSFLENVHPISCNNFLHPGSLCDGLDRAPSLLLLALVASSSKFLDTENSLQDGLRLADEAKWLVTRSLNRRSTLTITALQFLALHEMHNGDFTAASNLAG